MIADSPRALTLLTPLQAVAVENRLIKLMAAHLPDAAERRRLAQRLTDLRRKFGASEILGVLTVTAVLVGGERRAGRRGAGHGLEDLLRGRVETRETRAVLRGAGLLRRLVVAGCRRRGEM